MCVWAHPNEVREEQFNNVKQWFSQLTETAQNTLQKKFRNRQHLKKRKDQKLHLKFKPVIVCSSVSADDFFKAMMMRRRMMAQGSECTMTIMTCKKGLDLKHRLITCTRN